MSPPPRTSHVRSCAPDYRLPVLAWSHRDGAYLRGVRGSDRSPSCKEYYEEQRYNLVGIAFRHVLWAYHRISSPSPPLPQTQSLPPTPSSWWLPSAWPRRSHPWRPSVAALITHARCTFWDRSADGKIYIQGSRFLHHCQTTARAIKI